MQLLQCIHQPYQLVHEGGPCPSHSSAAARHGQVLTGPTCSHQPLVQLLLSPYRTQVLRRDQPDVLWQCKSLLYCCARQQRRVHVLKLQHAVCCNGSSSRAAVNVVVLLDCRSRAQGHLKACTQPPERLQQHHAVLTGWPVGVAYWGSVQLLCVSDPGPIWLTSICAWQG